MKGQEGHTEEHSTTSTYGRNATRDLSALQGKAARPGVMGWEGKWHGCSWAGEGVDCSSAPWVLGEERVQELLWASAFNCLLFSLTHLKKLQL